MPVAHPHAGSGNDRCRIADPLALNICRRSTLLDVGYGSYA